MKLFGWVHRKFRQNSSGEGFIDNGGGGNTCNCLSSCRGSPDEYRKCSSSPAAPHKTSLFENGEKDYSSSVDPFIFNGASFLSIGTLGFASIKEEEEEEDDDDEKHERDVSVMETITEKQADIMTVDELIAVGAELEKALATEAHDQLQCRDHNVVGATKILSSGEGKECPLQGYFFGSPVVTDSERREHRASLGELFRRSRDWDEQIKMKAEDVDHGGLMVKKKSKNKIQQRGSTLLLKKKTFGGNGSCGDGAASGESTAAAGKKAQLNKILQIFYRKVHPESSLESKKKWARKNKNKNNKPSAYSEGSSNKLVESMSPTNITCRKKKFQLIYRTHSKQSLHASLDHGGRTVNDCGHWIKTDSEYVVLEL